jgi:hypothetical protein
MTKSSLKNLKPGTAAYVVAHAEWKASRGKGPSLTFGNMKNPKEVLEICRFAVERGLNLVPDHRPRHKFLEKPHVGMKVEVYRLGETTGMSIVPDHLWNRKVGITGTLAAHVPGHGGDVWFVTHDGSDRVGAYALDELKRHYPSKRFKAYKKYLAALDRLPIENPTEEDMAAVCPHLTPKKAVAAFGKNSGYVACPPLRVRGALQIVSFSPGYVHEGKAFPACLRWSYAVPKKDASRSYQCMDEAIRFAETSWGNRLVLDSWVDVERIYLEDPSDLFTEGWAKDYPKVKAAVLIGLNRPYNELVNDRSRPQSVLMDEAIMEMALHDKIADEIKGDRGGFTTSNCAYCGSGLGLSGCDGCGHRFRDNQIRTGSITPLSPKVAQLLKDNGHVFQRDLQLAWDDEIRRHEILKRQIAKLERKEKLAMSN